MNPLRSPALSGAAAAGLLIAAVAWLAPVAAEEPPREDTVVRKPTTEDPQQPPKIEVVFVIDTTGSMGGLIEGAKQKVWSIANEILSGNPRPSLSVGLIAYRDRGDAYVTRVTQPTEDLDSIYSTLRGFRADGGGDGPEHVNRGLHDAFQGVQWSQDSRLKLVYLVGDAPAHRDYDRHIDYGKTVPQARQQGILVNAVLCGGDTNARNQFMEISRLGGGEFFQIAQSGGMTAVVTPHDRRMRALQRKLEETRVTFGSEGERRKAESAKREVMEMDGEAAASRASALAKMAPASAPRADKDLVEAYRSGRLADVDDEALPAEMQGLAKGELKAKVAEMAKRRARLEAELRQVVAKRDAHLKKNTPKDGFDSKVLDSLKEQAEAAGIDYEK